MQRPQVPPYLACLAYVISLSNVDMYGPCLPAGQFVLTHLNLLKYMAVEVCRA